MNNKRILKSFDKIQIEKEDYQFIVETFKNANGITDTNGFFIEDCISRFRAKILVSTSKGILINFNKQSQKLSFHKYKDTELLENQFVIRREVIADIFTDKSLLSLIITPAIYENENYVIIELSKEKCGDDDGTGGDGFKVKLP